jgi:hypothetical protein
MVAPRLAHEFHRRHVRALGPDLRRLVALGRQLGELLRVGLDPALGHVRALPKLGFAARDPPALAHPHRRDGVDGEPVAVEVELDLDRPRLRLRPVPVVIDEDVADAVVDGRGLSALRGQLGQLHEDVDVLARVDPGAARVRADQHGLDPPLLELRVGLEHPPHLLVRLDRAVALRPAHLDPGERPLELFLKPFHSLPPQSV